MLHGFDFLPVKVTLHVPKGALIAILEAFDGAKQLPVQLRESSTSDSFNDFFNGLIWIVGHGAVSVVLEEMPMWHGSLHG